MRDAPICCRAFLFSSEQMLLGVKGLNAKIPAPLGEETREIPLDRA